MQVQSPCNLSVAFVRTMIKSKRLAVAAILSKRLDLSISSLGAHVAYRRKTEIGSFGPTQVVPMPWDAFILTSSGLVGLVK